MCTCPIGYTGVCFDCKMSSRDEYFRRMVIAEKRVQELEAALKLHAETLGGLVTHRDELVCVCVSVYSVNAGGKYIGKQKNPNCRIHGTP